MIVLAVTIDLGIIGLIGFIAFANALRGIVKSLSIKIRLYRQTEDGKKRQILKELRGIVKSFSIKIRLYRQTKDIEKRQILEYTSPAKERGILTFGSLEFYAILLLIEFSFLFLLSIISFRVEDTASKMFIIAIIIGILWFIFLAIADIYFLILLYRVWRFIIDESRLHNLMPSIKKPDNAVVFLFIPFFNLYWLFQVFGKLPKDLNAIIKAKGSEVKIAESIGMLFVLMHFITIIISIIPTTRTITSPKISVVY